MATINVTRNHSLGLQAARQKAEQVAASLKAESWGRNLTSHWEGNDLKFEVPVFPMVKPKGALTVTDNTIRVYVENLTGPAAMMAPKIEAAIHEYLNNAGIVG